jgi:hypothetical protein
MTSRWSVWRAATLVLLLLSAVTVSAQSLPLLSQTDNQVWTDAQLYVPLTKSTEFVLLGTLRVGRNVSHPVDERIGVGFTFKAGKYLSLTPGYLYIARQPFERIRLFENRLNLVATVKFPLGKITLTDRSLFERRYRRPGGDSTRYRQRLQVDYPLGDKKKKLSAFVADEIFYDWNFNAWVRNRFTIGITKSVNKHLTTDIYYLRQNDGHARPGDLNAVGTAWRFRL